MSNTTPDPDRQANSEWTEQPDYLYHKQDRDHQPQIRARRPPSLPPKRKTRPIENAARDALWHNIRTFLFGAIFMLILLLIALFVTKRNWQQKMARIRAAKAPAKTATQWAVTTHPAARVPATGSDSTPATPEEAVSQALALAQRGLSLESQQEYSDANLWYNKALQAWPYLPRVQVLLGRNYLRTGEFNKARKAFEAAVRLDVPTPQLLNDAGAACFYLGDMDDAENYFLEARGQPQEYDPALFNLALCDIARDRLTAAERRLDPFLERNPNDPYALRAKALIQARRGAYQPAAATLQEALATTPAWPPLLFDLAAIQALMNRPIETAETLEKLLEQTGPDAVRPILNEPAFSQWMASPEGKTFLDQLRQRAPGTGHSPPIQREHEPISSLTASPRVAVAQPSH
jgi:Tfp pilus assembly protein PilF